MTRSEEMALVQRAIAGDQDAFAAIYQERHLNVAKLAYRLTHSREAAEDLTQDVFLKVFEKLEQFHGASSLSTWIYRIAFRLFLIDKRKMASRVTLLPFDDSIKHPVLNPVAFKDNRELFRALGTIKPFYRRVLEERFFADKEFRKLARELKKPEGTLKNAQFRGLAQLRKAMGAHA